MEDATSDDTYIEQSFFDFAQYQALSNSSNLDTNLSSQVPNIQNLSEQAAITSPASTSSSTTQESICNSPKSFSAATSPSSNMLEKPPSRQPTCSPAGTSNITQQTLAGTRDHDSLSHSELLNSLPGVKVETPADTALLDHSDLQIRLLGVPETGAKSRVETQIKLCIQLVTRSGIKITRWPYLRVPESMLAKSKQRKSQQRRLAKSATVYDESQVLDMDATVFCVSDPMKKVLMCAGCVRRERKRAERKKDSPSTEASNMTADETFERDRERVLLFNCEPLINFSSGDAILPTRITCYCRHHNERVGFRIRFTMKDSKGDIIATAITPPIMITDDHKSNTKQAPASATAGRKRRRTEYEKTKLEPNTPVPSRQGSVCFSAQGDSAVSSTAGNIYPPSFPCFNIPQISDAASIIPEQQYTPLPTPSEERSLGPIGGESFPPWSALQRPADNIPTPDIPSSTSTALSASVTPSTSTQSDTSYAFPTNIERSSPRLDRLVPSQGPTYGGIEVTILGSGFYRGLTCLFGDRPAVTLCWSPTTLVCVLPAALQPGPVVVSFKEHPLIVEGSDVTIFTYYDANDQALLELALQVVGLKMTGKLHDAKRVAMGIVHGDQRQQSNQLQSSGTVQQHIIDALNAADVQDISLMNSRGHTMLHLAVMCGYDDLLRVLIDKGADIDAQDRNGLTPLYLACWKGAKAMVEMMLESNGSSFVLSKSYASLSTLNEPEMDMAAAPAKQTGARSSPCSRQSSLKPPALRRFHSLDANIRTAAPNKNMEENGLGLVQPKHDSRLYVFWVPLLLVTMAFLYCQVLDKQIFSFVLDVILPYTPRSLLYHT